MTRLLPGPSHINHSPSFFRSPARHLHASGYAMSRRNPASRPKQMCANPPHIQYKRVLAVFNRITPATPCDQFPSPAATEHQPNPHSHGCGPRFRAKGFYNASRWCAFALALEKGVAETS